MHVCMDVCKYVCRYACIHVCMYVRAYVRTSVCMSVCLYVCMSVCLYICRYVCMYLCMYALYRRLGGRAQWPNQEIISFCVVRARAAGSKVEMRLKCHAQVFPFPFSPGEAFPFPLW